MDFIEQLPESNGRTFILVILDRLTRQAIFVPTTDNINSEEVARLFLLHVFSKHGTPSHITSDRGSEFISHFFRSLGSLLGISMHYTSGHHPEANGQVERVNQTLEQYLRIYCNYQQTNWADLLPLAEFTYNNTPHDTTGISPFFANKGYNPDITPHPERDSASVLARDLAVDLLELQMELKEQITKAQKRYVTSANDRRLKPPDFSIGQDVFIAAEHIRTTRPTRKLAERYLGPFPIIAKPSSQSYTIRLPEYLRGVHPVFHVSQLELAPPNAIPNRFQDPPPPVSINDALEYKVSEILDSKYDRRYKRSPLRYYIRWFGYEGTSEEFDWVSAKDLTNSAELVRDYHNQNPIKPGSYDEFKSILD
jgi:hypothetical protein